MVGSGWALAGQRVESGVLGTDGASERPHRLDDLFFFSRFSPSLADFRPFLSCSVFEFCWLFISRQLARCIVWDALPYSCGVAWACTTVAGEPYFSFPGRGFVLLAFQVMWRLGSDRYHRDT